MRRIIVVLLVVAGMARAEPVPGAAGALNAFRAGLGAAKIAPEPRLQKAAEAHAADMARRGFFSHKGANGSKPSSRVQAQGYRWCWVAENIAKGQKSLQAVMASWAKSPGHRKNMAHRKAAQFGLARGPGNLWVLVLARPC